MQETLLIVAVLIYIVGVVIVAVLNWLVEDEIAMDVAIGWPLAAVLFVFFAAPVLFEMTADLRSSLSLWITRQTIPDHEEEKRPASRRR